jgi:hypothetical protein
LQAGPVDFLGMLYDRVEGRPFRNAGRMIHSYCCC